MLDAYEKALGDQWSGDEERERIKVVSRQKMTDISLGKAQQGEAARDDAETVHWTEDDHIGRPGEMGKPTAPERFDDFTGPSE